MRDYDIGRYPRVSNEEQVIGATLRHVLDSPGASEVIVVDGHSADRTVSIARQFSEVDVVFIGVSWSRAANERRRGAGDGRLVVVSARGQSFT